ncbi:histone H4 transcription factor-like isoform X2 [Ascaphus truei]|uniref:histone H4 transcription factor-like isoform X2 n=1 Tax=Ascaphus truei TaxID=8439 RepID=UPI003F5A65D8
MAHRQRAKSSALMLACEWGVCTFAGKSVEEISDHINGHLKEHLSSPTNEPGVRQCLWRGCELWVMYNPNDLIIHVNYHCYHTRLKYAGTRLRERYKDLPPCSGENYIPDITQDSLVCSWKDCDYTFNHPEWFYRHVNMHTDCIDNTSRIVCCWKEHRFMCQLCEKHYGSERLLRDHVRGHSSRAQCPHCGVISATQSSLKTHVKYRHSEERPFPCDFCSRRFKDPYDLQKHVEIHNEDLAYYCSFDSCGFTARSLQSIRQHHKRAHEGTGLSGYICHICEKCFSWGHTLTTHLRKVHGLSCPPGRSRFSYKRGGDGHWRLNTADYKTASDSGQNSTSPAPAEAVSNSQE